MAVGINSTPTNGPLAVTPFHDGHTTSQITVHDHVTLSTKPNGHTAVINTKDGHKTASTPLIDGHMTLGTIDFPNILANGHVTPSGIPM